MYALQLNTCVLKADYELPRVNLFVMQCIVLSTTYICLLTGTSHRRQSFEIAKVTLVVYT
jgi:hypothetical protein